MLFLNSIFIFVRKRNCKRNNSFIQIRDKSGIGTIDMGLKRLVNSNIISIEEYESWIKIKNNNKCINKKRIFRKYVEYIQIGRFFFDVEGKD